MKSVKVANGPFFSRSSTICPTIASPTFRTAESPNVMSPSTAAKSDSERLISGTSTRNPMDRHSCRYSAVRSLSRLDAVSRAAMYSAG